MVQEYTSRSEADSAAERAFLEKQLLVIEKGLGRVAAESASATPLTQRLDALDRAREITTDLLMQVHVRPLDDAIAARLDWLERVEARQADDSSMPKTKLDIVALDRRLLEDLRDLWRAENG
jgi:hypothetical protein